MTAPWQQARRILCVRLDSLGDVLMCTPAMRALREAVPGRTLVAVAVMLRVARLSGSPAPTKVKPARRPLPQLWLDVAPFDLVRPESRPRIEDDADMCVMGESLDASQDDRGRAVRRHCQRLRQINVPSS